MIKNLSTDFYSETADTRTILKFLHTSPKEYRLTGSRFFGNFLFASDWDFYTEASQYAKAELKRIGFKEISVEVMTDIGYDGSQFSHIFEYRASDGVIQVQLVQNVKAKDKVQDLISTSYLPEFILMKKHQQRKLWSLLLNAVGPS